MEDSLKQVVAGFDKLRKKQIEYHTIQEQLFASYEVLRASYTEGGRSQIELDSINSMIDFKQDSVTRFFDSMIHADSLRIFRNH